ncbi:BolA/IbaG family iron-sulfur metabolism protein [Tateyamaria omphalii]|uniref:BolA family protein n=1 Tax=Tateyamaria omphalii TaxID=299262 RepID=UPI001C997076|nr:BolA/IbaG family iron-sulfur metabolism protein [Tateyamaria omphalii]MBY5932158.1 BolA/IbaG family iron-sulfur metabolism protein [Tateyamaria omphalii]
MTVRQEIEDKLRAAFNAREIEVVDDSASHAGHAGAPAAGQSHFNVMMRSAEFEGKNRLSRHRAVHAALGPELIGRIHALALDLDV